MLDYNCPTLESLIDLLRSENEYDIASILPTSED